MLDSGAFTLVHCLWLAGLHISDRTFLQCYILVHFSLVFTGALPMAGRTALLRSDFSPMLHSGALFTRALLMVGIAALL